MMSACEPHQPLIKQAVARLAFCLCAWLIVISLPVTSLAQTPSPLTLTPAGEQFTQALAALPNSQALSIDELQQLTVTMLSEEASDDLANAWAETLVWRFAGSGESAPQQMAFTLYAQGLPWSRINGGDQEAVWPAQALDELLTSRSASSRLRLAIEWSHQLEDLARRGDQTGAAAAVVLHLANRFIETRDQNLAPLPDASRFVNNNANLWLWELLASELRGQKNPTLQNRLARVDGPMERRSKRTTVRGWGRVIAQLPGPGTREQGGFQGNVPVSDFTTQPSQQVRAFFEQVQRHKASFLPTGQTEQPATVSEIQAIVGPPGSTNPSLAIEFCRVSNDYAAIIFDRTPPDQSRVAVVRASSLNGVLERLNRQKNYQGLVVVLGIDSRFEPGDYDTLNNRFTLARNRNELCLLCPSLSMLTKNSGAKSQWNAAEVLRYAHYADDFSLKEIPTGRRVNSFTFLNHFAVQTTSGRGVLLMHD